MYCYHDYRKRTDENKHLNPKFFNCHRLFNEGIVEFVYCPTEDQAADIGTKPLAGYQHERCVQLLGMVDGFEE